MEKQEEIKLAVNCSIGVSAKLNAGQLALIYILDCLSTAGGEQVKNRKRAAENELSAA